MRSTLGDNRKVDFSRAMIFLTSNLGSKEMTNLMTGGKPQGLNGEPLRYSCRWRDMRLV